jgi:proteic killer suppression protein
LILIPADDPVPRKPDGGLDWAAVSAVEVLEIADTH